MTRRVWPQMAAEEHIVKQLVKLVEGDATFHAAACEGLRTCEKGCDRPFYNLQRDGTGKECEQT